MANAGKKDNRKKQGSNPRSDKRQKSRTNARPVPNPRVIKGEAE